MALSLLAPGSADDGAASRLKINAAITEADKVTAIQATINTLAPKANPAFTGTPTGITKIHVGLGNVDNTADVNKPVSTAVTDSLNTLRGDVAEGDAANATAIADEATARQDAVSDEAEARVAGDAVRARIDALGSMIQRPGDAPALFTAETPVGDVLSLVDIPGDQIKTTANGKVAAFTGPGIIAAKLPTRIEPGRQYQARFVVQRVTDSIDPANDGLELCIQYLNASLGAVSTAILATLIDLETDNGRLDFKFVLAREDASNVDAAVPASAVYARLYVRAYGYQGSGETHVEVVAIDDLTNTTEWSPDVSAYVRQLAGYAQQLGTFTGRMGAAEEGIVASHDAGWLTSGTLPDARLSNRVVFRDIDSEIGGSLTLTDVARLKNHLHIGDGQATGGGPIARITRHDDRVAIEPSNLSGGVNTDRALQFDPEGNEVWESLGGFRTTGLLTTTGALAVGDAPASRASLDVYSKAETVALFDTYDLFQYKSGMDCSGNPNYPTASKGHVYIVTVAGKIGGASGADVDAGDLLICATDGSAAGTQAAVGANWDIVQFNITILPVAKGGTGAATLTGYVKGNGTSAMTASVAIPEGDIADGTIFPRLAASETVAGLWTVSLSTATTLTTYASWRPTNYGAGNPALNIVKTATASLWEINLYDGTNSNGTINIVAQNFTLNGSAVVTAATLGANLTAIQALVAAADQFLYATAPGIWALGTVTPFARTIMDDADKPAARATLGIRGYSTIATDAAAAVTFAAEHVRHTGVLTADRAITFDTTGAVAGDHVTITRTGAGAFNLNVGTGPLKAMAVNTWAKFVFDGSAVYLAAYGLL